MQKNPIELVKSAPVTTITTVEAALAVVLTWLATHGVIHGINATSDAKTFAPMVALVLPVVFNAAKHALVAPMKKVGDLLAKDGHLTDTDFARLEAIVQDLTGHSPVIQAVETLVDPASELSPETNPSGGGMGAGGVPAAVTPSDPAAPDVPTA